MSQESQNQSPNQDDSRLGASQFRPMLANSVFFPHAFMWRIGCSSDEHKHDTWHFDAEDRDLAFATKRDCEIAIRSLADAGIVEDCHMLTLTDDELARLCFENLKW